MPIRSSRRGLLLPPVVLLVMVGTAACNRSTGTFFPDVETGSASGSTARAGSIVLNDVSIEAPRGGES
jgi:copper(I)-binding protein